MRSVSINPSVEKIKYCTAAFNLNNIPLKYLILASRQCSELPKCHETFGVEPSDETLVESPFPLDGCLTYTVLGPQIQDCVLVDNLNSKYIPKEHIAN